MPEIVEEVVRVTTTGSAGSASGNADSPAMMGFLLDIYLDYHASAASTTDATIAFAAPARGNIAVVTDNKTDILIAPRMKLVDNAGAAITNSNDKFPLNGKINVALAQCDALTDAVVATIRYLRL
jgi:hypothetical protein